MYPFYHNILSKDYQTQNPFTINSESVAISFPLCVPEFVRALRWPVLSRLRMRGRDLRVSLHGHGLVLFCSEVQRTWIEGQVVTARGRVFVRARVRSSVSSRVRVLVFTQECMAFFKSRHW